MYVRSINFTEKVSRAIKDCNMISGGETVTAALSGGADSVSLLLVLRELSPQLGITLKACHLNHGIRGEESRRDALFCENLCKKLSVPFILGEENVPALRQKHESIEECARRVRYEFLEKAAEGGKLATAHNQNDCAETMLLNLMRGTGLKGLCGIPPVRGNIIRPLIYCSRSEVEEYLRQNNTDWVTDSTNLSEDYTRNKIRRIILPEMTKINGSLLNVMSRAAKNLREDSDYLENLAENALKSAEREGGYDAQMLSQLPAPLKARALRSIFTRSGIQPSTLRIETAEEILSAGAGKFNPCRGRFFVVKKGLAFVEISEQHYRKHEKA